MRSRAAAGLTILVHSLRRGPAKPVDGPLPSLRRAFSSYEQINLIDKVPDDQLRFQGYTETGFKVNGVDYEGSLLIVDKLLMPRNPKKFSEINPDRNSDPWLWKAC